MTDVKNENAYMIQRFDFGYWGDTEAMMINFPAPADPPMRATIKLGIIAKHLVKKFLSHGFSVKSRNP